jgi:peptide deformylase
MSLQIVNYPHPALRVKGRPVERIDRDLQLVAGRMLELMYESEGLGLAAQQVGLDSRIIVINFVGDPENQAEELVAVNPVIVESSGVMKGREGCLSFPGLYQDIRRPRTVKVQYYSLTGEACEMVCSDLAARIWQHEIDHLNGGLFIDKMGPVARLGSRKALDEFIAEFEQAKKKGQLAPDLVAKY